MPSLFMGCVMNGKKSNIIQLTNIIYLCTFQTSGATLIDDKGSFNGTNYNVTTEAGVQGNWGVYNGSTAYTAMPNTFSNFLASNFSLAFWVYSNADDGVILSFSHGSYSLVKQTGTSVIFNINNADVLTGSLATSDKTHVGITRSTTAGLELFINGVSVDTDAYTGTDGSLTYENAIGRYRAGLPAPWQGKVCQIVASTDIWPQSTFAQLYNNGNGKEIQIV